MKELTITPRQLNRFCHRIWSMTPGEVVEKMRKGEFQEENFIHTNDT